MEKPINVKLKKILECIALLTNLDTVWMLYGLYEISVYVRMQILVK